MFRILILKNQNLKRNLIRLNKLKLIRRECSSDNELKKENSSNFNKSIKNSNRKIDRSNN
jgi:hypothetical protein